MDWSLVLTVIGTVLAIIGLIGTGWWQLFGLRSKDLGKVYSRIDKLVDRMDKLSERQTRLETKLNNGIAEEILKLRATRHEHANAIQTLRSEVEHIKDMLK